MSSTAGMLFKINLLLQFLSKVHSTATGEQTIKPLQHLKWFIFREDCFDTFFTKNDFFNQECIKFTILKLVGFLIIAGAFILKVP